MPNRILRDYTLSEKVNELSWQAECFFIRLMMKADDFGSFHANPKIIRSSCFPLRSDSVRDADISRWMDELQKSGLIVVYAHGQKQYLRIIDFRQRLQNMRNKFPDPPEVTGSHGESPPEENPNPKQNPKGIPPPSFADGLKSDRHFFEQLGTSWGIDETAFEKMIDRFVLVLSSQSKTHTDPAEFKSHFFNWGSKKFTDFNGTKSSMASKMENV